MVAALGSKISAVSPQLFVAIQLLSAGPITTSGAALESEGISVLDQLQTVRRRRRSLCAARAAGWVRGGRNEKENTVQLSRELCGAEFEPRGVARRFTQARQDHSLTGTL